MSVTDKRQVDWDRCIADVGSALVASFKKLLANSMQKIKDKAAASGDDKGTPPATPAKTPKSSGTKRKGKVVAGDEDGTPTKKKRGKKAVKADEVEGKHLAGCSVLDFD